MESNPSSPPINGPDSFVGSLFADRYRVTRVISEGAKTLIADAIDEQTGRNCTLKIVRARLSAQPSIRDRFDETMRGVAAMSHPNIAAVYDWGFARIGSASVAFVVVEQLSGGSLRDMFDRGRQLTPSQGLTVGLEACRALDYAHRRGFVHGELTPAKIVFGDDRRLRIIDFGLSELLSADAWERLDSLPTHIAWYAAPEQGPGQTIDGKADVYALSLILHEAVTGQLPFKSDSTVATLAARQNKLMPVSADLGPLAAILERSGRPEPGERSSAADLGAGLVKAASKLPRPEPLPLLSTGLFDVPADELRAPHDPTGGILRPQGTAGAAVRVITPDDSGPGRSAKRHAGNHDDDDRESTVSVDAVAVAPSADAPSADVASVSTQKAARNPTQPVAKARGESAPNAGGRASAIPNARDFLPYDADLADMETTVIPQIVVESGTAEAVPKSVKTVEIGEPLAGEHLNDAGSSGETSVGQKAPRKTAARKAAARKMAARKNKVAQKSVTDESAAASAPAPANEKPSVASRTASHQTAVPERPVIIEAEPNLELAQPAVDDLVIVPVAESTSPATSAASDPKPSRRLSRGTPDSTDTDDDFTDSPSRRSGVLKVLAGLLIAAALIGLGVFAYTMFRPASHPVPDLVGVPEAQATAEVNSYGWVITTQHERSDEVPEAGSVVRTVPAAGVDVPKGDPFLLVISDGPVLRELPNFSGMTSADAQSQLRDLQLNATVSNDFDETVPVDSVISWTVEGQPDVVAGATVAPDSTVHLVVSKGPAPRVVPNIVGRPTEEAAKMIGDLGLVPTEGGREFSDDVAAGVVIRQSPAPDSSVARGTPVTFVVSNGPDLVTFPALDPNSTYNDVYQKLIDAGFQVHLVLGDAQGVVSSYQINGQPVEAGQTFKRGTQVDITAV